MELIACMLAHRFFPALGGPGPGPKEPPRGGPLPGAVEHIDCSCGAQAEDPAEDGGRR